MNNKGFTMVELLASVAILGILSGLAITAVSAILDKAHEEYYNSQEKNLVLAAQAYYNSNKTKLPKVIGKKEEVTATTLKESNYLKEDLKNYDGKPCKSMDKSYVTVFKYGQSNYSYTAYLNCGSRSASKSEKEGSPDFDVEFLGVTMVDGKPFYKNVGDAKVDIYINGDNKNPSDIRLISYSYIISKYDSATNRYIELVNTGNKPTREFNIHNKIDLTKFTIKGEAKLKVTLTATNINGNTSTKTFINNYKDDVKPECEYTDIEDNPKSNLRRKTWIDNNKKITVKCKDGSGSGCEKEKYTKTFSSDGGIDYIKIADVAGNTFDCPIVKFIDKTAPTVKVTAYKCNSNGEIPTKNNKYDSSAKVGYIEANNANRNVTLNSKDLDYDYDGWLNKANYPHGVCFAFEVSDQSSIKSKSWKWNSAGLKANRTDYKTLNGGSSNKSYEYQDGYNLTNNLKFEHSLREEGLRYGEFIIEDGIGNKVIVKIDMKIDRTNPDDPIVSGYKKNNATDISTPGNLHSYSFGEWYRGWVFTNATSNDNISGVEGIYLTTTGQGSSDVTNKKQNFRNVNIEEGVVTLKYRAKDYAGNLSNIVERVVKLDRKAPNKPTVNGFKKTNDTQLSCSGSNPTEGTYDNDTWYNKYAFTRASGSVDRGVGGVEYHLTTEGQDNDANDIVQNCRNVHKQGIVKNKYRACDKLDNCSEYTVFTIKLDRGKPDVSLSVSSKNSNYHTKNVNFSATSSDSISGVEKYCRVANASSCTPSSAVGSNGRFSENDVYIGNTAYDGSVHSLTVCVADRAKNTKCDTKEYRVYTECTSGHIEMKGSGNDVRCGYLGSFSVYKWSYDSKDCSGSGKYRKYNFKQFHCRCNYDKHTNNYCNQEHMDITSCYHGSDTTYIYYNNSDNGKDACNTDKPINSYVKEVCNSDAYFSGDSTWYYHGWRFYSGETANSWIGLKSGWTISIEDAMAAYGTPLPLSGSAGQTCASACKIRYGN